MFETHLFLNRILGILARYSLYANILKRMRKRVRKWMGNERKTRERERERERVRGVQCRQREREWERSVDGEWERRGRKGGWEKWGRNIPVVRKKRSGSRVIEKTISEVFTKLNSD
jgi:hypothetical protein